MKIDHIGIAVKNIEEAIKFWQTTFNITPKIIKEIEEHKVRVAIFDMNGTKIELITPLKEDSPITKFLATKGEGLHHICFEVKNIDRVLDTLKEKGIKLIDETPRKGVFTEKVAFLHPKSTSNILIELCEK